MPRCLLAIYLVQLADLCIEAAPIHKTKITLAQECESCKFGTRDVKKRMKVESID
jgi:hypothetical protein